MRIAGSFFLIIAVLAAGALGAETAAAKGSKTTVKVGNNFFDPEKKKIRKGTNVRFKWSGGGPVHNVTKKRGPAGKFASETTSSKGVNFSRRFKQRGTYRLLCTIHPSQMNLKLTVK